LRVLLDISNLANLLLYIGQLR